MSFFVRRALRLPQIRSQLASITQRRGLADAAGKDGAEKVHFWKQPLNPSKWKDNEVLFASMLFLFPLKIVFNEVAALAALEKLHNENKEIKKISLMKEALYEN